MTNNVSPIVPSRTRNYNPSLPVLPTEANYPGNPGKTGRDE